MEKVAVMTGTKRRLRQLRYRLPILLVINSAPPAIVSDQRKPPFQFSIAFLLWLTAACAFVLGIATWVPSFLDPAMAAVIAVIITLAYRKGTLALRCSLVGGTATTVVAFIDWCVNVATLRPSSRDPVIDVFEALLFAIIGLLGGLGLATLPSNREKVSPPQNAEQRPSQ